MENPVWKQLTWLFSLIKKGGSVKDIFLAGALSGLIGAVAMDISGIILWKNKKTEGLYGHLAGSMIMPAYKTNQRRNFIIGQLFHLTFGSIIGILMTHIFKFYGKRRYLLKGVISGLSLWGIFYNFGQKMNFYNLKPHLTRSGYAAIWHHILYGIVTSQAIMTLTDSSLFPEEYGTEKTAEKATGTGTVKESNVTPFRQPQDNPARI